MSYAEEAIQKYLDDAAAKLPAPGGGSVAALVGALGASMAAMVANFTVGKKKYADVQDEIKELLETVEEERKKMTTLVDADVAAYGKVSAAYGMPKNTDEQKKSRSEAIKTACRAAMAAPMVAARSCLIVATACERLVHIGNKNLITDVGVSVLTVEAAMRAAALNVEINLSSIGDEDFARKTRSEVDSLIGKMKCISESVMAEVNAAIS